MGLRFLAGVAVVAAVATGLVKRRHKQLALAGETPEAKFNPGMVNGAALSVPPDPAVTAAP